MKKFIKDVIILQIGTVGTMLIGLVTSLLIAKILRPSGYGVYCLVFSLYGLINIFGNFGVNTATVIKLAEAYARQSKDEIFNLLSFYIKASLIIGIIILSVGFIISPYLADILYANRKIGGLAQPLFLMALLGIFYKFVVTVLQGTRQIRKLAILENLSKFIFSFLVVILLLSGYGINGAVWGWVISAFSSSLLAARLYRQLYPSDRYLPSLSTLLRHIWNTRLRPYFKFSFSVAISNNLDTLYEILPVMLLGIFIVPKEVGYFKFGYSIISLFIIFLEAVSKNLSIKLPYAKGKDNIKQLKEVFFKVSTYSGLISILVTIVVLITSPLIIKLWFKEYLSSLPVIYILSLYFATYGFWIGLDSVFKTLERLDIEIKFKLLSIILLVSAGPALITNMGIIGLSIMMVIAGLATKILLYIRATKILKETEPL